jgi:GTPase
MPHRAGYAVIVGRPNVGKSTITNALLGSKLAIVSPKPQTTRNRILGIKTRPDAQIVLLDTPGLHDARSSLNRRMVEVARDTVTEADVIVFVIDAGAGVLTGDAKIASTLTNQPKPVIVVCNKLDRIAKSKVLPQIERLAQLLPGCDIIPLSAKSGDGLDVVENAIVAALPERERLFPEDQFTTETERFLVQEMVREQLFLALDQELPYGVAVVVDQFTDKPDKKLAVVSATILVERPNHKAIVIGKGGTQLREVGRLARIELERLLGRRLYLELFVRVEPGWARNRGRLAEIGL